MANSISEKFNLKKQFVFYASYHNDPFNIMIHVICIWPILATAIVLLQVNYCYFTILINKHCFKKLLYGKDSYRTIILVYSFFQYTPTVASTPAFIENLPFGKDVQLNAAFFLILIYIGKFIIKH